MDFKYLECSCYCPEHVVRVSVLPADEGVPPLLVVETQLYRFKSFWKRLVAGLKYIFGSKNECQWDCAMLDEESVSDLCDVINEYWEEVEKELDKDEEPCDCSTCNASCCTTSSGVTN